MRTLALAAVCAAVAVAPAAAEAKTWRGKTKQGRPVKVVTGADGLVNRVKVRWRAPCRNGHYRSQTLFLPPLDLSEPARFEDAGTYRSTAQGGYRGRHTVFVGGTLGADDRWTGTFRVRTRVMRRGRVIDRCQLKRVTWTAEPVS